ncbi:MAG: IS110 family transposase [Comamonadaceae bacterium]|nr:MAG: IS110 family transposase [Comamonadaceae bacterium]
MGRCRHRRSGPGSVKILLEIGDLDQYRSRGHLAAYAGLAPRTHRSGTSIKGENQQRAGNKRLKIPCSRSPSPRFRTLPHASTTTESAPRANDTMPQCCASRAAGATCCTPCSNTAPPTSSRQRRMLGIDAPRRRRSASFIFIERMHAAGHSVESICACASSAASRSPHALTRTGDRNRRRYGRVPDVYITDVGIR